jgi:putative mRNA 3-end processing factor
VLSADDRGLFCAAGGFHIDPWGGPVDRAVLTHAHADHAKPVMKRALVAAPGVEIARARLPGVEVESVAYGEVVRIGDVDVSLHPSGHVLGAAQVRVVSASETWVVSGDYKLADDPTTTKFEPVSCDVFVSEATYGLPIFRWDAPSSTMNEINAWWSAAKDEGRPAILYGYALGKLQRVLAGVDASIGPIFTHGAAEKMIALYRAAGVSLPETRHLQAAPPPGALILAPPSAQNTPWAHKITRLDATSAFCSGWMRIRGLRRRRTVDRGFALSDHADWPALLEAVKLSKASRVLVTHGHTTALAGALGEMGVDARVLSTHYEGELASEGVSEATS